MASSNRQPVVAYIALGSNLQDPQRQVRAALRELGLLGNIRLLRTSSLYRSAPVGYSDQPDFVNAVAAVETRFGPKELLDSLLTMERRCGRVRDFPNAPRTLDLDIVLYGDLSVREPGLEIPHPRMHERAFVLVPLAEIAPDAVVPGRGPVKGLLAGVDAGSLVLLAPPPA